MGEWALRLRVAGIVWVVTLMMMIPAAIATVFALMIIAQMYWGEAVSPGLTVAMVTICAGIAGASAGLVATQTCGYARRVSNEQLRAAPTATACALTVAALLVMADQGLLTATAPSIVALIMLPPAVRAANDALAGHWRRVPAHPKHQSLRHAADDGAPPFLRVVRMDPGHDPESLVMDAQLGAE